MKKRIIPVACVILLVLGLAVSQEASREHDAHLHEHQTHSHEHDRLEVLDRNIRLTFELADDDGETDERVTIVTAIPQYKLVAQFENAGDKTELAITGAAGPRNDGRILVLMEVEAGFGQPEREMMLAVECGVLLEPGQECEVAQWGDRTLVVHADHVD